MHILGDKLLAWNAKNIFIVETPKLNIQMNFVFVEHFWLQEYLSALGTDTAQKITFKS